MHFIKQFKQIHWRGIDYKYLVNNLILCIATMLGSSLMVVVNQMDIPGVIHRPEFAWDRAIPLVPAFILAYYFYFPFVFVGFAFIFFFWPKLFRPYATSMMIIGIITGIINITYQTYAPRAIIEGTDIFSRVLAWSYTLARPLTALSSLHVAHTLCTAYFLSKIIPRQTWVFVTVTLLVSASTLLVKHHYIADAVTGGLLGITTCMVIDAIWSGRVRARTLAQQESKTSLV